MSVEMLQISSYVCFGIAAVLLIAAIVLYFVLDVPALFGELTGRTERRAIADIQMQAGGNSQTKPSHATKAKKSKKGTSALPQQQKASVGNVGTAKLSTGKLMHSSDSNATTVLGSNETTVLNTESKATTVLNEDYGATAVLKQPTSQMRVAETSVDEAVAEFSVDVAFGYASSAEIIE